MAIKARQVQIGLTAAELKAASDGLDEGAAAWLVREIERGRQMRVSAFPEVPGIKRRYPGEAKGKFLVGYLGDTKAKFRNLFLRSLRLLQDFESARLKQDFDAIHKLRPNVVIAYRPLIDALWNLARRRRSELQIDIHEAGLLILPTTTESLAALAILLLEMEMSLHRVRQCLYCGVWFYARFKHQRFCRETSKNCQWNYYHTPEWRKKNRERNLRHQREYRKRLFERGRQ
jgi:hypothetical protein